MIEFELDGRKTLANAGSTILEVALKEGKYIPHFCYHKKLSIAANCRMCLVEVEKANKPLPACATPISEGMKVYTHTKLAIEAQQGVMEFLLINHPLDCPICDQGGECQLQDLALGYGKGATRFNEEKRAVGAKDFGALIATEMTRCIHCSRCVRFSDEIGGYQELGLAYRNNHAEIVTFKPEGITSEISGNMIDLCPVGALTSKPFRHFGRSWELSRRKTIAPHDGLGSNLIAQVDKYHKVVRVLPLENEALNECWISDRDRFSYEGLYHQERITTPKIKQDGQWINITWESALNYAAQTIEQIKQVHGSDSIGALVHPSSTNEEMYLLQKLMRSLGSSNIDHRLAQLDFSLDKEIHGISYLGGTIKELCSSSAILLIGCLIREEQPLLAQKIRTMVKNGAELNVINYLAHQYLVPLHQEIIIDPRALLDILAQIAKALVVDESQIDLSAVIVSADAHKIAQSLFKHQGNIFIGQLIKSSPDYTQILILANQICNKTGGKLAILSSCANEIGANLVGCVPYHNVTHEGSTHGLNAYNMLKHPRKAYLLLNTELEHDSYDSSLALDALLQAESVIVMTSFSNENMLKYADLILPITPFSENCGSYFNMAGLLQKFKAVTRPLGESKAAWKVLRVIANHLNLTGFEQEDLTAVEQELIKLGIMESTHYNLLGNAVPIAKFKVSPPKIKGLSRIGYNGIYQGDSLVRRATHLQQSTYAQLPVLEISPVLAAKLKLKADDQIKITQAQQQFQFKVSLNHSLSDTVVLVRNNIHTVGLGGLFDQITITA